MANKQMEFQRQQSGTTFQRGRRDMEEAGLNPLLMMGKPGAPAAGGAQPNLKTSNVTPGISAGVSSAIMAERQRKDRQLADENIKLTKSATKLKSTEGLIAKARLPAVNASSAFEAATAKMNQKFLRFDAISNRAKSWIPGMGGGRGYRGGRSQGHQAPKAKGFNKKKFMKTYKRKRILP